LFTFVFIVFVAFGAIAANGDDRLSMVVGVLGLSGALIYICNKIFLPMLHGETILEIDEEKLQYLLKDLTLYWKDIEDLDYEDYSFNRGGMTMFKVRFTMKESGSVIRISPWLIEGDSKAIFDSILTAFLKYR
jgi:hypothetical protein